MAEENPPKPELHESDKSESLKRQLVAVDRELATDQDEAEWDERTLHVPFTEGVKLGCALAIGLCNRTGDHHTCCCPFVWRYLLHL